MLGLMSNNYEVKVAGTTVTIKQYDKENLYGYEKKTSSNNVRNLKKNSPDVQKEVDVISERNKAENPEERIKIPSKENFDKSTIRARVKLFDLVACNLQKEKPKFLTLTFREDIKDLNVAHNEFKKFTKRLNHYFKTKRNFNENLQYVAVPEFQSGKTEYKDKNGDLKKGLGRDVIHYHIIYFNMPYTNFNKLLDIWGQGGVYIEGLKENESKNIVNIAKYVCKYISKENSVKESNYDLYIEKGLINRRRYFPSQGLKKAIHYRFDIDMSFQQEIDEMLIDDNIYSNQYQQKYISVFGETNIIKNEIVVNVYELNELKLKSFKNFMKSIENNVHYVNYNQELNHKFSHTQEELFDLYQKEII